VVAIGVALGVFCGGLLLACVVVYMKRSQCVFTHSNNNNNNNNTNNNNNNLIYKASVCRRTPSKLCITTVHLESQRTRNISIFPVTIFTSGHHPQSFSVPLSAAGQHVGYTVAGRPSQLSASYSSTSTSHLSSLLTADHVDMLVAVHDSSDLRE